MSGKVIRNIVTDGLVWYLDGKNTKSFVSGNTIVNDLVNIGNDGVLTGTTNPTFNSNGYFSFDDSQRQYIHSKNSYPSLSTWTIEAWVRFTGSLAGKCSSVMCGQFNTKLNFSMGTNNYPSNSKIAIGFYDTAWRTTTGFDPDLNTWYHIIGTYDGSTIKQYVNTTLNGGTLSYAGTPSSDGKVRIATRWDDISAQLDFLKCDISNIKIYNRALSESEISQNYNALKNRYI